MTAGSMRLRRQRTSTAKVGRRGQGLGTAGQTERRVQWALYVTVIADGILAKGDIACATLEWLYFFFCPLLFWRPSP